MVEVLAALDQYAPQPQDDTLACYAPKIDKAEARIEWTRPASELVRHVQGLAPFPGAWFELEGERVKLLVAEEADGEGAPGEILDADFTIACGSGALRPLRLQRAGKPAMERADFLRGKPVNKGVVLTREPT
ncbi:MAG: hypothetical protein CL955_04030 [Erythrobacteraceae bacterium]|nr:hypothetical protein [Erythrobacteraceae bacterium]